MLRSQELHYTIPPYGERYGGKVQSDASQYVWHAREPQERGLEKLCGHSYNAIKHPSMGYSPYFLMFGRYPRLAIGAYLGITSPEENAVVSQDHYTTKLKKGVRSPIKLCLRNLRKLLTGVRRIMMFRIRIVYW